MSYILVVVYCDVRILSFYIPKIHSELSSRTHNLTVISVGFHKLLSRQSSGDCRFNLDCKQVPFRNA